MDKYLPSLRYFPVTIGFAFHNFKVVRTEINPFRGLIFMLGYRMRISLSIMPFFREYKCSMFFNLWLAVQQPLVLSERSREVPLSYEWMTNTPFDPHAAYGGNSNISNMRRSTHAKSPFLGIHEVDNPIGKYGLKESINRTPIKAVSIPFGLYWCDIKKYT